MANDPKPIHEMGDDERLHFLWGHATDIQGKLAGGDRFALWIFDREDKCHLVSNMDTDGFPDTLRLMADHIDHIKETGDIVSLDTQVRREVET